MDKTFIKYLTTSIITLNKVKKLALFATSIDKSEITNNTNKYNNYYIYIIRIDSFIKPLDFKKYSIEIIEPEFALKTMCKNELSYLEYITKIIWEGLARTNKDWCV